MTLLKVGITMRNLSIYDNVPHCKMIEEMLEEYKKQVSQQIRYEAAHRLIKLDKYSFEVIAKSVELSIDEVIEISKHPEYFDE